MRVNCSRCKTRFEFPAEKLADGILKVRCSKCGHVFGVRKKSAVPAAEEPKAPPPPEAETAFAAAAAPEVPEFREPPASAAPPEEPPARLPSWYTDGGDEEDEDFGATADIGWLDEIDLPNVEDILKQRDLSPPPPTAATEPEFPAAATGAGETFFEPPEDFTPEEIPPWPPPARAEESEARDVEEPEAVSEPTPPWDFQIPARPSRAPLAAFVAALLLFAASAAHVALTRPDALALLSPSADATPTVAEPVVAAYLPREGKRPLFVIIGHVASKAGTPPSGLRLRATAYGAGGAELASASGRAGRLLDADDLQSLDDAEILSRLGAGGMEGTPDKAPFMIVLPDPPTGIVGHAVRIVPGDG